MHPTTKFTILIVDDAPENIQALSKILYGENLNIVIAMSGCEALQIVASSKCRQLHANR
jgi:CheY-like chemotaxis protein